ncbi:MAG: Zn-ribbon domain-containing OB-fold protein [Pseudomonadales bacterium]
MVADQLSALSPASVPFWEGCRAGELRLQKCNRCAHLQFYPRTVCSRCLSDTLTWTVASGVGVVASYTIIRQSVSKAYADKVPYTVALVDLAEGPRMMSLIDGLEPNQIRVGDAVHVTFKQWTDDTVLPTFSLLTGD